MTHTIGKGTLKTQYVVFKRKNLTHIDISLTGLSRLSHFYPKPITKPKNH